MTTTFLFIKYVQEALAGNKFAPQLQSFVLIFFFLFFVIITIMVIVKPKGYYKEVSELPLEKDSLT